MQKPFFRICSLLLTVILLVNMLPMSIFAEEFQAAQAAAAAEEAMKVTDAQIVAEVVENRTEYSKQFKLDNGLFVAAVYAEPVHYQEDGQWKEIDNTLTATTDGTYTNAAGVWDVSLPQQLTGTSPISISKDGYTLSFQMAGELNSTGNLQTADLSLESTNTPFSISGTQNTRGEIQAVDFSTAKEDAEHEEFVLEKNTSQILYADVYENTDVQYDLQANSVKESIIMDSYSSDLRGYRYILKTDEMVPVLNEDGSIHFYDREENIVMTMPAPYLIDAQEQYNFDIQVNLEGKGSTYTLAYLLPTDWLAAEDRAWPVVLDPIVNADVARTNIQDLTVAQNAPTNYSGGTLECGYGNVNHQQRIYVQYVDLPNLTSSDVIVEANVQIIKAQNADVTAPVVEVHKVLAPWDQSTITWENQPEISPMVEDFNVTKYSGYYKWDITDIVRDWYSIENTGMVFKMSTDGAENPTADWQQFLSSEYAWDTNRPYLTIKFRNNNGIESYWDYATASAGRAGTGYVNTYTGNLTWIRSDLGFGGNRMPVSIAHAYNLNDSGENTYGMGYGWRTNFNQRVYQWDVDDSYYVWEDGDGTAHYFKYGSYATYYDEDSLNLTLKTNGSGDKKYSIADRQGNTTYFDTNGRMTYQENNQKDKSTITIAYTDTTGNLIDSITDGVDRKYDFTYNSDNLLSSISYYGNGTTALHTVSYAYTNGMLTAITDQDGKISSYSYDAQEKLSDDETAEPVTKYLLETAEDIDDYKLEYTYNDTNRAFQPYRVASVEESFDGVLGGSLDFEYAHNQTTLTDHNENVEILQFNNYGNTVCIQDDEGRAQYSKYTVNDASEAGKANQLRLSSKLQNTVSNLLDNSSFERDGISSIWTLGAGSGSHGISDTAYMGSKSLKITDDIRLDASAITVQPGKSCTLSAYVKAEGSSVFLHLQGNEVGYQSQAMANCDWSRIEVNYTNSTGEAVTLTPQIVTFNSGTVYVDCVQLEMNPTASRHNLVENGDFRAGTSGWFSGNDPMDADTLVDKEAATAQLGGKVYHATGNPTGENRISQTINISGKEGDTFVLTGWAKGDAVPTPEEDDEDDQRYYGIVAEFNYVDESKESETFVAKFNPDTDSDVNWQYSAEMMVAEHDYSSITVYIAYDRSANEAWFDGIQLFKEEFGHSYTYNEDGDVVSVQDLQNQNTEYTYDSKGNVLTTKQDGNEKMSYTYDSYSNLTSSTNAVTNVKYEYEYDDYGNNTSVTVLDAKNSSGAKITTTYGYANKGNTLASTTDALGKTTTYSYNADTNVLEWVKYPGNTDFTKTHYSYDNMYRTSGTAAWMDVDKMLYANYGYTDDQLSAIQTGSSFYSFHYNDFGLRSSIGVGSRTLASYTYTDNRNFYLDTLDYGNGDKVKYTYDNKGRVTSQTYEDNDTVTYHYDNYGALASVTHSVIDSATGSTTDLTTTYYYDFTDRLIKYVESGEDYTHSLSYEYDDKNRLKSTTELLGEDSYTYGYTYDNADRISAITLNDAQRTYIFDNYGRTNELVTNYITKTTDSDGKETETATQVKKDTYTFTGTNTATSSQIASHTVYLGEKDEAGNYSNSLNYTYTYDDNGNITSISDGTNTITYEYDTANQLTKEINPAGGYLYEWTYDNAGNIKERKEYAYVDGAQGNLTATVTYVYDDTQGWGDLLTGLTIVTPNEDETDTVRSFAYDNIGNPTNDGTWEYTWEHGRQLARMKSDSATWDYTYNVDGLRTSKSNGTTTYNYTYTGDKLTCMTVGDNTLYFAYDASGVPMSVTYNDVTYYYVTNVQGDVIGILDSTGAEVASYAYDAWGNPITTTEADTTEAQTNEIAELNPLRYRSYIWDSETELYYVSSRYYDPEVSRWINADTTDVLSLPYHHLGQYNLFSYCNNNPVNDRDDDGQLSWLAKIAIGAAAIAIGVAVTALTGGAALPALVAGVKAACVAGAISAGTSAATTAVRSAVSGDSFSTVVQKTAKAAVDGFADGFMAGGIAAGASQVASGGFKIAAKLGAKTGKNAGIKIGNTQILSPDAAWHKNNGGTLLKIGKTFRIDVGSNTLLHMHLPNVSSHIQIGTIGAGIYGWLK